MPLSYMGCFQGCPKPAASILCGCVLLRSFYPCEVGETLGWAGPFFLSHLARQVPLCKWPHLCTQGCLMSRPEKC